MESVLLRLFAVVVILIQTNICLCDVEDEDILAWDYLENEGHSAANYDFSKVVVVSRFDEDVNWILLVARAGWDVVVSSKDAQARKIFSAQIASNTTWQEISSKITFVDSPLNFGTEASSYLNYWVHNYYNLPDIMVMLHGLPAPHCPALTNYLSCVNPSWRGYMSINTLYIEGRRVDFDFHEFYVRANDALRAGGLGHLVHFPENNEAINMYCCAQFAITRDRILRFPKRFYEILLEEVEDTNPAHVTDAQEYIHYRYAGGAMEHTWHLLFNDRLHDIEMAPYVQAHYCGGDIHGESVQGLLEGCPNMCPEMFDDAVRRRERR